MVRFNQILHVFWQVLDKDIPSNDLVRHSLELVLHLLQQCLDLRNKHAKFMTTDR